MTLDGQRTNEAERERSRDHGTKPYYTISLHCTYKDENSGNLQNTTSFGTEELSLIEKSPLKLLTVSSKFSASSSAVEVADELSSNLQAGRLTRGGVCGKLQIPESLYWFVIEAHDDV
jgi:hypothetical protein